MHVTLRPATDADLRAVAEIERVAFSDPWSEASFAGLLAGARTRLTVAVSDGAIIGYSVLLLAIPDADLANLAVKPSARGRGVGKQLLAQVIDAAREAGVEYLYLEVRQSNAKAIAMYTAAGFQTFGLRRRYYREPVEDAQVLRLTVANG